MRGARFQGAAWTRVLMNWREPIDLRSPREIRPRQKRRSTGPSGTRPWQTVSLKGKTRIGPVALHHGGGDLSHTVKALERSPKLRGMPRSSLVRGHGLPSLKSAVQNFARVLGRGTLRLLKFGMSPFCGRGQSPGAGEAVSRGRHSNKRGGRPTNM